MPPEPAVIADRYELSVNATMRVVEDAWIGETLLFVLRERLGLPGAKNACEQGECGSCSVLLDGVVVCACLVLAVDAVGSEIQTVEGLSASGDAADIQAALVRGGGVQCGFCTPGFVVAIYDLLRRNPDADEMAVREALSGNLCRCTGYGRILDAVRAVQRARAS
jgi:carbon-monoxide dehydrogenase small subunit